MDEKTLPQKILTTVLILVLIAIIVIAVLTLLGPSTYPSGTNSDIIMSI